jgi:predicted nuclease of predicted toxin-antitoxin system
MKPILLIADESVDFNIVKTLRKAGHTVMAVAETNPSASDKEVLNMALKNNALLITEDKDFGELVHRFKMKHCGILLIRLISYTSSEKAELVSISIENHWKKLKNVFSVLDERKIRIRK